MTATQQKIINTLRQDGRPALAVHEFELTGISESALSARLREMRAAGLVVGAFRLGKPFKEWRAAPGGRV